MFDQAIYAKVQEIQWANEQLNKRLVVRLGEFHTCMSFLSVIGKRFCESGLRDILIESRVVAARSVNGVLSGHHYNRSIYAHKAVFESVDIDEVMVKVTVICNKEVCGKPNICLVEFLSGDGVTST